MRTTIEISDHQRSVLVSLAAQRGLRGYSEIIQEALDKYIAEQVKVPEIKEKVLALQGSWQQDEAEQARSRLLELREKWSIS